jgi:hypothetical protein
MSSAAVAPATVNTEVTPSQKVPIVRVVVETPAPRTSISKFNLHDIEDAGDDDLLDEAADAVVHQLLADRAEEIIKEALSDSGGDIDPKVEVDEELEASLEAIMGNNEDDGFDPKSEVIVNGEHQPIIPIQQVPAEGLMRMVTSGDVHSPYLGDGDDLFAGEDIVVSDLEIAEALASTPSPIEKKEEENMKVEEAPPTAQFGFVPQALAEQKAQVTKTAAAITNLKSVEGRILTLMEVAFPDHTQRDAIKSLIKKEFRREMNKVNRTPDEDDE